MLQSIDTLIAFVVIMTVASLFVTILVQMASAALSLRGKNLANALALAFQTIAPKLKGGAHQLAAKILSDPLLSDSTRTTKDRLDRLVTKVERVVPWNFRTIKDAMRLATAVRPEEVYGALKRLAEVGENPDADARTLLAALFLPQEETANIQKHLGALRAITNRIAEAPVRAQLLTALEETPANLLVQADAARLKFDAWFETAQNRAQQWFRVHVRGLTICASFLVAFVFQLDAVEIFHRVSVSPELRTALVAASQSVAQSADESAKPKLLAQLEQKIDASGFDFVPTQGWRWPEHYCDHLVGMLLFSALLTLGAPYWYNILKNLTSLRPALAQAIGREEDSRSGEKSPNE